MEQLSRIGFGAAHRKYKDMEMFIELCAYQDTGIKPYQIQLIQEDNKLLSRQNKEYREEILSLRAELFGYREAEEQGLLLKLPCKVGNVVYHDSGVFGILDYKLDSFSSYEDKIIFSASSWDDGTCDTGECLDEIEFEASDIGKTVFITREAALKGGADK